MSKNLPDDTTDREIDETAPDQQGSLMGDICQDAHRILCQARDDDREAHFHNRYGQPIVDEEEHASNERDTLIADRNHWQEKCEALSEELHCAALRIRELEGGLRAVAGSGCCMPKFGEGCDDRCRTTALKALGKD